MSATKLHIPRNFNLISLKLWILWPKTSKNVQYRPYLSSRSSETVHHIYLANNFGHISWLLTILFAAVNKQLNFQNKNEAGSSIFHFLGHFWRENMRCLNDMGLSNPTKNWHTKWTFRFNRYLDLEITFRTFQAITTPPPSLSILRLKCIVPCVIMAVFFVIKF